MAVDRRRRHGGHGLHRGVGQGAGALGGGPPRAFPPTANDHLHIAVTLVRDDGTRASVFRDYKTMSPTPPPWNESTG